MIRRHREDGHQGENSGRASPVQTLVSDCGPQNWDRKNNPVVSAPHSVALCPWQLRKATADPMGSIHSHQDKPLLNTLEAALLWDDE